MAKDSEPQLADPEQNNGSNRRAPRRLLRWKSGDNVTKIGTDYQNRETTRRRITGILSLLLALVLVVGAVLLVVYRDRLSLDRVHRRFSQWDSGASGETAQTFSYEAQRSNVYALAGENLAIGSGSGLILYDAAGNIQGTVQQTVNTPFLRTGKTAALLADLGADRALVMNTEENLAQTLEVEQTIYGADLAEDGAFCLLTDGEGCKTMVRVYNAQAQEVYQWRSATYYLSLAALSDDGSCLASLALGTDGTGSRSILQILKTDSTDGPVQVDLGSENVLMLDWMGDTLIAFGETQLAVVEPDGSILGRFGYDGRTLQAVAVASDLAAAAFDAGSSGGQCLLTTISPNGSISGQTYLEGEARCVSAAGDYVAVTTGTQVSLYTRDLTAVAQWTGLSASCQALARSDGAVLVVSGGEATLYEPN